MLDVRLGKAPDESESTVMLVKTRTGEIEHSFAERKSANPTQTRKARSSDFSPSPPTGGS